MSLSAHAQGLKQALQSVRRMRANQTSLKNMRIYVNLSVTQTACSFLLSSLHDILKELFLHASVIFRSNHVFIFKTLQWRLTSSAFLVRVMR